MMRSRIEPEIRRLLREVFMVLESEGVKLMQLLACGWAGIIAWRNAVGYDAAATMKTPKKRLRPPAGIAFLVFLALTLAGCGPSPPKPVRGYLLISIDTLRADVLGSYGYPKPTSPFLDSLAARSVLFENAYVQLPGTLPSHMSMLTGLYPMEHGVYPPNSVLSPRIPLITEIFQRAGFKTAGFTEGGFVHRSFGFDRGFDEWDDKVPGIPTDLEVTLSRGLEYLKRLRADDRFFLFLHSYVVHDPYTTIEPYTTQFGAHPVPGAFPPLGEYFQRFNAGDKELTISPEALAYYRAAYDASVRYMDDRLAGFFRELEELGMAEDLVVIVTSDHGEEFLEHGKMVHGQLYPENLHVPLIIHHPRVKPRRVTDIVESIDLAPTFYELAGLDEAARFTGESLVPFLVGSKIDKTGLAYAEAFETASRTLIRDVSGKELQYLELEPDYAQDGIWLEKGIDFDFFEPELRFTAHSYKLPRRLEVWVDGAVAGTWDIEPETVQEFRLKVGEGQRHRRLSLRVDGCTVPAELGHGGDTRCIGARIQNLHMPTVSLFDLAQDPFAQIDISDGMSEETLRFYTNLQRFGRRGAPRNTSELEPELVERLKSLGYLR